MTEGETSRLLAWDHQMRAVHERLREALRVTQDAVATGRDVVPAARELLLYCRGFCAALAGHHEGEDRVLFPAIEAAHPELRDTVRRLTQDHSMIAHLLRGLEAALGQAASVDVLDRHLEGIAAIMESHFRYEERAVGGVLAQLQLDARGTDVFGPL